MKTKNFVISAICVFFLASSLVQAQVTVSGTPSTNVRSCDDFATVELNDPWDMENASDFHHFNPLDVLGITGSSFDNGVFSFQTTVSGPTLYLWSPQPAGSALVGGRYGQALNVDRSKFTHFTVRMSTDLEDPFGFNFLWDRGFDYATLRAVTDRVSTNTGWDTYTLDLNTLGISAVESSSTNPWSTEEVTGLAFRPATLVGSNIKIDYIRLEDPSSCGNYSFNYGVTASGSDNRTSIYLDNDGNVTNGVYDSLVTSSSSGGTFNGTSLGLAPGVYDVVAVLDSDYASLVLNNPWDMSETSDIGSTSNVSNFVQSGGVVSGTATGTASVPLEVGSAGINTSIYHNLSIKLTQSSNTPFSIVWSGGGVTIPDPAASIYNVGGGVFQIDLTGEAGWTGTKTAFSIRPTSIPGVSFSIDFVSLRQNGFDLTRDLSTVQANSTVFEDAITINTPPTFEFIEPDSTGGVAIRPWDMNPGDIVRGDNLQYGDDPAFPGESYTSFLPDSRLVDGMRGDFFKGRNVVGSDDPVNYSALKDAKGTIEFSADDYHRLCFKLLVESPFSLCLGSVGRIFWKGDNYDFRTSEDVVLGFDNWSGTQWQEYCLDMKDLEQDQEIGGTSPGWEGNITGFRIDPHEIAISECGGARNGSATYYFDYIKLRKDDAADDRFNIVYTHEDPDGSGTVSLYYSSTDTTSGGTLITTLSSAAESRVYSWDTSSIPNGVYYLYGVATDGVNVTTRKASGPIKIDHGAVSSTVEPVLSVEAPQNADVVCSAMQVKGYALQSDRFEEVAAVEVLVNGERLTTFEPKEYSPTAVSAFPDTESSNTGFDAIYDTSGLAFGSHTVEITAYSTDGNSSTETVTVNKAASACTPLVEDDAPNGDSIGAGDLINSDPDVKSPKLKKVKLSKRGLLTFSVARSAEGKKNCSLSFFVSDSASGPFTPVKTISTKKAKTNFRLKKLRIDPNSLGEFYLDVVKSCPGLSPLGTGAPKKVAVSSNKGKITDIGGVVSKFSRLKLIKKKRRKRK